LDAVPAKLVELLTLERVADDVFRGGSHDIGSKRVFGGQVLGQALAAATRTVEGRAAHSLHAYFLRPGDVDAPIYYEVDRSRDGHSFTSRRVVASQAHGPILHLAASFHAAEDGFEHHTQMPQVPPPEALRGTGDLDADALARMPQRLRRFFEHLRPFDIRPVEAMDPLAVQQRAPVQHLWMRTVDRLPDDDDLHRALLAYLSDYYFIPTATLPHGLIFQDQRVQMASLDHAMWFHRPARVDEWLLFAYESPCAAAGRALARGQIYTRAGAFVASTAQEGLLRRRPA
jgi:acyl-CoA thioesterase II